MSANDGGDPGELDATHAVDGVDEVDEVETHPRIRERREAVVEAEQRVRNRRWIVLAALVGLALLAFLITRSPLLDVDEVRVIGTDAVAPEVVRVAGGIEPGAALMGLDLEAAEARILALPRIADITSSRTWGGLVTYEVVERTAVARIDGTEGIMIVAADGVIVELRSADLALGPPESDLVPITGAMFASPVGTVVPAQLLDPVRVAAAMPTDVASLTEAVELAVDSLMLRLVGGGAIEFGDARMITEKFEASRALLGQVDLTCVDVIDVRAPTSPTVQRLDGC